MNKIQQKIFPAIIVSENIPFNTNWLDKLPEDIKTSAKTLNSLSQVVIIVIIANPFTLPLTNQANLH